MDIQRLRNLTTGRLHTEMEHIVRDLGSLTGMHGIPTHILPNALRAVTPWLKEKVSEPRFWDDKYDATHVGEYELTEPTAEERADIFERYKALSHPFEKLGKNRVAYVQL